MLHNPVVVRLLRSGDMLPVELERERGTPLCDFFIKPNYIERN